MKCDACGKDDMFMVCRECAAESHETEAKLLAERARSAALQAENERMRELSGELVSRFETVLDHCARHTDVREGRERLREFRSALSQPAPTEKKP